MTKREIQTAYWIGDIVFLRSRSERLTGMVTGISVHPGNVTYRVGWGSGVETWHYDIELSECFVSEWETMSEAKGNA